MKRSRFLLPFTLGALAMLAVVVAASWGAPGVLGRVQRAVGVGVSLPGVTPEVATAPPASAHEVPPALADPRAAQAASPASAREAAAPTARAADALGLLIPVQGVAAASLVDTYEDARGQGRRHDAIDIMAARGTPILAVSDGVVMKLFQSERGGITLYELAPDQRTIYYYAHLDRYAPGMVEGRRLRRGEVLGYVGNTGDAGPGNYHLHFEVSTTPDPARYWGGIPRNPYPLLR